MTKYMKLPIKCWLMRCWNCAWLLKCWKVSPRSINNHVRINQEIFDMWFTFWCFQFHWYNLKRRFRERLKVQINLCISTWSAINILKRMALLLSQTNLQLFLLKEWNEGKKSINNLTAIHCHVLITLSKCEKKIIFNFMNLWLHANTAVSARNFINYGFFIAHQRKMSFI